MSAFILRFQAELRRFIAREDGQDLVEYALLVSLVALAAIAAIGPLATAITGIFHNASVSIA